MMIGTRWSEVGAAVPAALSFRERRGSRIGPTGGFELDASAVGAALRAIFTAQSPASRLLRQTRTLTRARAAKRVLQLTAAGDSRPHLETAPE
jgi:hypothetical protein